MKEKRTSNESSDSEDDIWEYKSVKRVRKKPDGDELSNSFNIAQSKVTVDSKRKTRRSLTQVSAKDTGINAFKTTSKNKRNKPTGKSGDGSNGKDDQTKRSRGSVASLRSILSSPSQQPQQALHSDDNKASTSASTSTQGGRSSQSTSSQRSSRGGKGGTGRKSSTKKKNRTQQTPQSKILEKPKHEGSCPFCQMPFSVLTIESPRWHVTECMDLPLIATQECPSRVKCDSTIPGHFRKFRHTLLANVRAGVTMETDEDPDDMEHRRFSRKLNFDSGAKTDTTTSTTTTTLKSSQQRNCNKKNCDNEDRNVIKQSKKLDSETTQVIPGNTCTQTFTVTNSNDPLGLKVALKRKGSELTVDAVKKTLFQTPVKDEEQLDCDVTVKLEQIDNVDHVKSLSKQARLHDDNNNKNKNKKAISKKQTQEKRSLKAETKSKVPEKNRVKRERPGRNDGRVDSGDVESDQDVFSDDYNEDVRKLKVGGRFAFDRNKRISDMLADPNRNISDMLADALATTTEDDTQGSDNEVCDGVESSMTGEDDLGGKEDFSEVCDGTESSMAGEDDPGVEEDFSEVCDGTESSMAGEDDPGVEEDFSEVCDGTESSMAGEDETFLMDDLTETEENNDDTHVEETQDLDYFGHSLYGNTGATTIVKETQKKYPNNIDDGCHGNFANNTLIETDRQLDKVEEDGDYDVVIVAAESISQNDASSSKTRTRQYVNQARAHSTSGAGSPGGRTSGGRTYRRGYRTSRLSRNRPSNNKNARLQNAASDSKQASVLDFFQPLWGKAKQAVETLTNVFSPPDGSNASTKQHPAHHVMLMTMRLVAPSLRVMRVAM